MSGGPAIVDLASRRDARRFERADRAFRIARYQRSQEPLRSIYERADRDEPPFGFACCNAYRCYAA